MAEDSVLFENPWMTVTSEQAGRLVRITRTSEPFTDEALATLKPVAESVLPPRRRRKLTLRFDTRLAPLMGDEAMERKLGAASAVLVAGFARSAVLVRTAVGKLQATRFSRANDRTTHIFDDEAAALRYLLAEPSADEGG